MHSILPTVNQKEAFRRPPPGVRKIVIATSIAETSITIDDVIYVVDSGKLKTKSFDMEKNVLTLEPEWETLANARQRRGRAGRQVFFSKYFFTRKNNLILRYIFFISELSQGSVINYLQKLEKKHLNHIRFQRCRELD